MSFSEFLDVVIAGIFAGGLYLLVGLSMVITFRATQVLNIAAGQFLVLGAFLVFWLAAQHHVPIGFAFLGSVAIMAAIGATTQFVVMRPVIGQPVFVAAIITLGLSSLVGSVVDVVWGSANDSLPLPFGAHTFSLPIVKQGAGVTNYTLATLVLSLFLAVSFVIFERRTSFGLQLRAAAEDALLASFSGVRINRCFQFGWIAGSVVAGLAGLSFAYTAGGTVNENLAAIGLGSLAPVVLAGFSEVDILIGAAMFVGVLNSVTLYFMNSAAANAVAFAVLLIVVLVRPTGLTGARTVRML